MFAFLGKLMGIAIRSKEYLNLNLPSFMWKLIVNDKPTLEDLEGIDSSLVKSLQQVRDIDKMEGMNAEMFAYTFEGTPFTTISVDGRTVELVSNGANVDLTFENRATYCKLVLEYHLQEFNVQAAAVRKGLGTMIPLPVLSIFCWHELEQLVCGSCEIDVELLEKITEYNGCGKTDAHVRLFWQAINEFNQLERSALVRFVWGRSRLPLTAAAFTQRFKLQAFSRSPADSYFPVSHTCFFSLELPAYSSLEIMKDKLRYACFNCEAIDGDDSFTTVANMGEEF